MAPKLIWPFAHKKNEVPKDVKNDLLLRDDSVTLPFCSRYNHISFQPFISLLQVNHTLA
jgi:hypothetical protein